METILVTEPEFRKGEQVFGGANDVRCEPVAPDERALADAVIARGARAVVIGVTTCVGPLYEALASVAAVSDRRA
ncbi:MAG: hypothetical protein HZA91_11455, partial [Verrucomicrobia bacterium]|nr:hypothetical protein [Verrucomicrobiota bacterium]